MDLNEITEMLHGAARSVGAEVTSPWFYMQFGIILTAAGLAFALGSLVRSNVDPGSFAMGWPVPLRISKRDTASSSTACSAKRPSMP